METTTTRLALRRIAVSAIALAGLAACQSSPLYRHSPEEARAVCAEYGFKPGTDGMAGCVQQLEINRQRNLATFGAGALARPIK